MDSLNPSDILAHGPVSRSLSGISAPSVSEKAKHTNKDLFRPEKADVTKKVKQKSLPVPFFTHTQ